MVANELAYKLSPPVAHFVHLPSVRAKIGYHTEVGPHYTTPHNTTQHHTKGHVMRDGRKVEELELAGVLRTWLGEMLLSFFDIDIVGDREIRSTLRFAGWPCSPGGHVYVYQIAIYIRLFMSDFRLLEARAPALRYSGVLVLCCYRTRGLVLHAAIAALSRTIVPLTCLIPNVL